MNFAEAFNCLMEGKVITRRLWGKRGKVYLVENRMNNIKYIEIRNVQGCIAYTAFSDDLLANDWEIFE